MCYNIASTDRVRELLNGKVKDIFALDQLYHVSGFAQPDLPVIVEDTERRLELMHWGFIPSWTKSEEQAIEYSNMSLNAKAETIFEKPMFRQSILTKRCVLPVDGFYEWRDIARVKYPYYIFPSDKGLFYFGCIYDTWTNMNTGEIINSFSILTTEANETMAMIHNTKKRMPLILDEQGWQQWINPNTTKEEIQALLKPSANEILAYHTISKAISHKNVDCNYPEIQNEVVYPEKGMQLEF